MNDKAAELYRAWLTQEPDNAEAQFHLKACTQENVPDRAPDDYITSIFDSFAKSFDAKLAALSYRAPELVGEAVAQLALAPNQSLDVLDAGCGTGLCGPLLRPWARWLAGVDLSEGMLAKAQTRGVYDELTAGELVTFLRQRPAAFDLVTSADTLCYFGVLDEFCIAARSALRARGILVFTVEAHADDAGAPDFRLQRHGRYSHRQGYLINCLQAADLHSQKLAPVVLRMEVGKPVDGWLVSARAN
jgi:predicted TPR repeat methyltransferase